MSSANTSLIAALLVVKTTSEARLAFHYPPLPGEDDSRFRASFEENSNECASSSSSEEDINDTASEDSDSDSAPVRVGGLRIPFIEESVSMSPEDDFSLPSRAIKVHWTDLFGFPSSTIARLLCPPTHFDKRPLEVSIDGTTFLGQPVYPDSEGRWSKQKARQMTIGKSVSDLDRSFHTVESRSLHGLVDSKDRTMWSIAEENEARGREKSASGELVEQSSDRKGRKALKMFNICLVLNTPPLEHRALIKEVYEHVVHKFIKALRIEQARSNYVANEASIISSMVKRFAHTSGSEKRLTSLYKEILAQSSLARAIANIYNSVTASRIASLTLSSSMALSIQLPLPSFISRLPGPLDKQMAGTWLTTATSIPFEEEVQTTNKNIFSYFGLLLLHDLSTILADIGAAKSSIAGPLSKYLRLSKPTKSFSQISQLSQIPLHDIQMLASHLIYWRRARAIPPLSQRDIYIPSPNADLRNLTTASLTFAKTFPNFPSMPNILASLSGTPRPFAALIPSKDHKAAYLDILAWLMRGGWVTQLRSFACVRMPPKAEQEDGIPTSDRVAGLKTARIILSSELDRDGVPVGSLPAASARDVGLDDKAVLTAYVQRKKGVESAKAWDLCLKYFDGKHSLDLIPALHGWKRNVTEDLIVGWEEIGVLVRVRHW